MGNSGAAWKLILPPPAAYVVAADLENAAGDRTTLYGWADTLDEAIANTEALERESSGDESWKCYDWRGGVEATLENQN